MKTTLTFSCSPACSALALFTRDNTLAIVDPSSLKVIAKIPAGNGAARGHRIRGRKDGMRFRLRMRRVPHVGGGGSGCAFVVIDSGRIRVLTGPLAEF